MPGTLLSPCPAALSWCFFSCQTRWPQPAAAATPECGSAGYGCAVHSAGGGREKAVKNLDAGRGWKCLDMGGRGKLDYRERTVYSQERLLCCTLKSQPCPRIPLNFMFPFFPNIATQDGNLIFENSGCQILGQTLIFMPHSRLSRKVCPTFLQPTPASLERLPN